MKKSLYLVAAIVIGIQLILATPVFASDNEVLVRWKGQTDTSIAVMEVDDPDAMVRELQANPFIDRVEKNVERRLSVFSDDPFAGDQYHLKQDNDADIDAGKAWDITTGSSDIVVAVIDTGIDLDHPDLVDAIWQNSDEIAGNGIDDDGNGYIDDVNGWDFVGNDNDPNPTPTGLSWSTSVVVHGTHVAGLIGATGNNGTGISGVNWNVTIMPIRVFTDTGLSNVDDIYNAVLYAANNGADVINMSYGGTSFSTFEQEAIEYARDKGVLSVAAAGNESTNLDDIPLYPVCHPYVLGVTATDAFDETASFTNYGTDCADLAAPGDTILSAYYADDPVHDFTSEYGYLSGTSMASPIAAGVAALVLSVQPSLSPDDMQDILIGATDNLSDDTLGSGRLNAYQSVVDAQVASSPDAPSITAYHNSKKKKTIAKKTRTPDTSPYFTWSKPSSLNGIAGYYVYWGNEKKNPVTKGNFQTKKNFAPTGVRGNEKDYRLRIVAEDVDGNQSDVGTFKYISDTKISTPVMKSVDASGENIEVLWKKLSGEHVAGWYVYRAVDGESSFSKYTSLLSDREFIDTNVVAGHTYRYKVKAVDDLDNESKLSNSKQEAL